MSASGHRLAASAMIGFLLFGLFAIWAAASPVGSIPDEYQHYKWAYVLWTGQADRSETTNSYDIPTVLAAPRQACYTFQPDVTPACDTLSIAPEEDREKVVQVGTTAQWYPPTFYVMTGWPLRLWPNETGVFVGRTVNAAAVAALLAWSFAVVLRIRRPFVVAILLFSASPMVAFFAGGYNPQALEIAGAVGLVAGGLVLRTRRGGRNALALTAVSAFMLSTTRPQSYLWTVMLAIGLSLAVDRWPRRLLARSRRAAGPLPRSPRSNRLIRWSTGAVALAALLGWLWTYVIPSVPPPPPPDQQGLFMRALLYSLLRIQEYPLEWVGKFGHLDTPTPVMAVAMWWSALGGIVLAGWSVRRHRRVVGVSVLTLLGTLVVSVVMEVRFELATGGVLLQGRYVLPMVALSFLLSAWALDRQPPVWSRRWLVWAGGVWVVVHVWAVVEALRRNMYGLSHSPLDGPSWHPPVSAPILVVGAAVVTVVLVVVVYRVSWRRDLALGPTP